MILTVWLKRPMLLGSALFLVLGALFVWIQIGQKKQEGSDVAVAKLLSVKPSRLHLGKLNQFEKKEFAFNLKNEGQEPIRILKVDPSCGCTEAKALKDVLTPGEETRIIGSLNAENRVGEFGSQILVSYQTDSQRDHGGQGAMQLKMLVGSRAVTLVNLPSHLDLGSSILGQEPKAVTFEVTKGEADIDWNELRVHPVQSKVVVKKISDAQWQVEISAPKGKTIGGSREDLTLELLNSKNPGAVVRQEKISASWKTVSENFSISPSGIYLSGDRVADVRIKSLKGRPVDITRLGIPLNAHIQVTQVKEDGQLHLKFQNFLDKGKAPNQVPWSGKIQIGFYDGFVEETYLVALIK
jgi:hypothetical protein